MAEVAKLVGMEIRDYTGKDGQRKRYCGLHLVHIEGSVDDVIGSKVECVSCPRNVNPDALDVGSTYELEYSLYDVKGQKMARLSGLLPVLDGGK